MVSQNHPLPIFLQLWVIFRLFLPTGENSLRKQQFCKFDSLNVRFSASVRINRVDEVAFEGDV
jgi:hypothetical protein